MIFNDNTFYMNNWADFVHKGAFDEFLKKVAAVEVPGLNIDKVDRITFQRDDNGEYRLLLSYLDENHEPQSTVLQPAITDRVIQLANQEIVKHFLFNRRGEDVSINTMRFIHDKLELTLIDGEKIELDLKPLVPRIHVEDANGKVLQKELNYHIDGNKIIFVDMTNHQTVLDFTKLLTVEAFNTFKDAIEKRMQQLDTDKLDAQDFTDWLAQKYEPDLAGKVNVTDFDQFKTDNQKALDTKLDKETYDQNRINDAEDLAQKLDKKLDKTAFVTWQVTFNDQLNTELNKKVDKTVYDTNRQTDKDETAANLEKKVDKTTYNQDRAADSAALSDALSQKADVASLTDYQTHAEAAAEQKRVNDTFVTRETFDASQHEQDEKINSKASASDVAADLKKYYTKEDLDAIIATLATKDDLNSKANASEVAADFKKYYTKEEVDAIIKTSVKRVFMPYAAADGNWHIKLVQINDDGTITDVTGA